MSVLIVITQNHFAVYGLKLRISCQSDGRNVAIQNADGRPQLCVCPATLLSGDIVLCDKLHAGVFCTGLLSVWLAYRRFIGTVAICDSCKATRTLTPQFSGQHCFAFWRFQSHIVGRTSVTLIIHFNFFFNFLVWGETESTSYVGHNLAYCTSTGRQMIMIVE
jgi:hypothetical protein